MRRNALMMFTAPADPDGSDGGNGGGGQGTDPDPAPVDPPADPTGELGEGGKKALQAERDARKQADKRVTALEQQLAAATAANETATQEAQAVQSQVEAAQAEALRYKVAAKFGISAEPGEDDGPSDAEMFLTGSTEEELTNQAQRLASYRKQFLDAGLVDPTQGGGGRPAPVEPDPGAPRLAAAFDAQITNK